jgi:hypothetical protein
VVKGEGKATGKVAGRVKVKPNGLPDYPVITGNWINYLLWPQCPNGVRRQSWWDHRWSVCCAEGYNGT